MRIADEVDFGGGCVAVDVVDGGGVGGLEVGGYVEGLQGVVGVSGAEELAFADGDLVGRGGFAGCPEGGYGFELLRVGGEDDALRAQGAQADEVAAGVEVLLSDFEGGEGKDARRGEDEGAVVDALGGVEVGAVSGDAG